MSNDPFNQSTPGSAAGGYPDPAQNPMTADSPYAAQGASQGPPSKSGRTCLWVLGIGSLLGVVLMIACCGGGYFLMGTFFDMTRQEINTMADVQEQFGPVESMSMNLGATVTEAENNPEYLVFDITSDSGKQAQLAIKMSDQANGSQVEDAILIQPDGQRVPIDVARKVGTVSVPAPNPPAEPIGSQPDNEPAVPSDATEIQLQELESALDLN